MPKKMSCVEVRSNFSDTVNKVIYGQSRVILYRRGKAVAALVTIDDLRVLENLDESCNEQLHIGI